MITRYLPIFALDRTIYENVFIILDGDKEPDDIIPYSKIPNGEMDDVVKIEKYIKNLTSSYSAIKPLIDGNKQNGGDEYQKLQVYKEYLEYAEHPPILFAKENDSRSDSIVRCKCSGKYIARSK